MFFNFDSMPFIVTGIMVGGLFSYSFYYIFTQNLQGNESLVNTIQPNIDSISELPETVYPVLQPNVLPDKLHVDVGVQTSTKSLYAMFKDWLIEAFSINTSDIGKTPTDIRVENWIGDLDTTQIVSTNSMQSVVSNNQLPDLIKVGESGSNLDASSVVTDAVVDYSYVELSGNVVERVISEATIHLVNETMIQAANAGPFIGFC